MSRSTGNSRIYGRAARHVSRVPRDLKRAQHNELSVGRVFIHGLRKRESQNLQKSGPTFKVCLVGGVKDIDLDVIF